MNLKSFFSFFEGRLEPPAYARALITQRDYEDIQYHAWQEGMTRAAEIARGADSNDFEQSIANEDIANEIEAERDATNTLWPRPML